MVTQKKTLVLLDAHAIIHRAYHALPQFTTRDGFPTGAVYGFVSMILKIIDDFHPDYIVAAYDLPKPTFRHETFEGYKGTRKETDEELKMQIGITRTFCELFSIPIYDSPGFEADDILGTIAEKTKDEKDLSLVIASGDMDTLQLVEGKRVRVFTLKRGLSDTIIYDEKAVRDRFGFAPPLIVDYKALRGDPSDNIPGIRGIGEKTALFLVNTFGTIEEIYRLLEEKGDEYFLSKGATKRQVKLLREGKDDAEFSKILATIRRDAPIDFHLPSSLWFDRVRVEEVIRFFQKYEFRSLPQRFLKTLEKLGVENSSSGQNSSEQSEVFDERGLHELSTMLHLIDSDYTEPSRDDILNYTGERTFSSARIKLETELRSLPRVEQLFLNVEKPLISIVEEMEQTGILLNTPFLENLSHRYHEELKKLEEKIYEIAGESFNIKSPKQLSEILFEKMKLSTKGIKKSKSGSYSTNVDNLKKLEGENEIIPLIIEYRELQKLLSTYIDVLPEMVKEDGRIHAEFLQNGTSTGRFSSRNPNLQNIPTRTGLGRAIREAFIAPKGKQLVSFDYSQIELRILALLSEDEGLKEVFRRGGDIHRAVAARIAGISEEEVDREMRRKAKVVNFGILYGMGIRSLEKEMGTTKQEAQMFYEGFFTQFPKAGEFLEATKRFAHEHGYTETLFGRRRQFRDINSKLPYIRAMAERMALNAPIQGTAADIIKTAMVHIYQKFITQFPETKLLLQIHDEIIYEVPEKDLEVFIKKAKDEMEHILERSYLKHEPDIPLLVHVAFGLHWGELK